MSDPMSDPTREALRAMAASPAQREAVRTAVERIVENELRGLSSWRIDLTTRLTDAVLAALSTTPAPEIDRLRAVRSAARAFIRAQDGDTGDPRQYAENIWTAFDRLRAALEGALHECDDPECYGPSDTRCGTHNCTCHCHRSTP